MRILVTVGMLAGSLAMVGCSKFTTELKSAKFTGITTPGLIYKLPAKQFSLSTTYQVTGCELMKGNGNKVNLDAKVEATLSERLVGAEAYTISYQELDSWTKITNMEFHLSEAGLLTGINTGIADQTGAVIQNIVSTATGIARAIAIPPVELTRKGQGENAEQSSCSEVNALLEAHKKAKAELKAEQKNDKARDAAKREKGEAEAEVARLSALKDVYEALGKEAAKDGLMTRIQEQEKRQADADSKLKELGTSSTDKFAEVLANTAAALTITTTKDILPQKLDYCHEVTVIDNDIPPALRDVLKNITTELPKVTLEVSPIPDACTGNNSAEKSCNESNESMGIAYRIPVAAMARVRCADKHGTRMLIEQPTQVPQFGPVGSLDLKNGAFANNTLEVAFNTATGAPEKLVFHSKSRAEVASASARDAANSYLQLQKDKRDDIRAANKAAIDQQTSLLALEKTRNDVALASSQAAATAALLPVTTEKSLVEAQIDLLRDQQRLDAVRTGTASTAEVQLEALVNQQKLLEQQLKILQIEQQIAEQKAKAQTDITP